MISPELAAAAAQSKAAYDAGRADGYDHMILALAQQAQGNLDSAEELFRKAMAFGPDDPSVLAGRAKFLRETGRLSEAVATCDRAITLAPQYADAWIERGAILSAGGSNREARASYARAIALAPDAVPAHAGIASLAAREGDGETARTHAGIALSIDPGNAVAAAALATVELESGEPARAAALLEPIVAARLQPDFERSLAAGLLGDARHRLGDHAGAYEAYRLSKADFAAIHAPAAKGRMRHFEFIEAIHTGLSAMDLAQEKAIRPAPVPGEAERHIFLIGYPRSGTTLMENVLASLPGVEALEERPTLSEADRALLSGDAGEIAATLARFATVGEEQLNVWRTAYWAKVVQSGITPGTRAFVDMDPLKGTRLPLIARLFPEARIVIMRRDPRDVVWSCFRTQFAMTSGTLDFTTLQDTARHYDALMRLTEHSLQRLPLTTFEVHYHRLVRDFEPTTRALCQFLGLEWDDAVLQFDRTARQRGVATASVGQVRRGLYDGTRQWEPYAQWLEPVMPVLQPWVEKFGYA
ncbi:sulfotransferase [Novosphingobium sp. TH158]|uniref:tetratricopeptide repeat-containing sulfotransferase family protein n=1 Tax=Novosphingobium sp. TH158 TaxID=2067455 RepID=UPI000C7C6998|nr:sulfotransferase [Novosphingobium sp. TH158]PLK27267.1 hypothetical protein C0V78_10485 [Novosphingobium sp. TH158]